MLLGAIVFEGASLIIALKQFRGKVGFSGLLTKIRKSKDSAGFAVIIEDIGALMGLVVALIGLLIGDFLNVPIADGIASIVIGGILCGMAVVLAVETKGLLLGESLTKENVEKIRQILTHHPAVEHFGLIKSIHFGPESVLLALEVEFKDGMSTDDVEKETLKIEHEITTCCPHIDRLYVESKEF